MQAPPIPVTVVIAQDWTRFSLRLRTEKITSRSVGAYIEYLSDTGELRVKYFYDTDPKAEFRTENPPQAGCAYLTWTPISPKSMSIRYTNDRGLGGDITLQRSGKPSRMRSSS